MLAAGFVLALLVLGAAPAFAHASLIRAAPAPGANVPQPPGAVVLYFSEPIDQRASTVMVTGPDGRDATSGPAQELPTDRLALRRPLALGRPGRYDVTWTSQSADDGHRETGHYSFGVAVAPSGHRETSGGAASSEGVLALLSQIALVASLTIWTGSLLLDRTAARAGVDPAQLSAVRTAGPALALGAIVVRAAAAAAKAPRLAQVVPTVLASRAGWLSAVIAVAATIGLLARAWPLVAVAAALGALTAQAAAGHAGAAAAPAVAVAVLVVHLTAASVWLFAIAAALLARRLRRALAVLSPYAIGSAVAVAASGVAGAALERVHRGQLLTTGYGRVLLAKAFVFLGVAALGGWHAHLRRHGSRRRKLQTPVRLEAAAAGLAVIVASVLAASPPPTVFSAVLTGASADPVLGPLDGNQALSVADATGPYVVGLTLSPPRAGPVKARVEILSSNVDDVFSDVSIHATSPTSSPVTIALAPAGGGAFAGGGRIASNGAWSFGVSFRARGAANVVTFAIAVPSPDGTGELAEAFAAEDRLTSVRLHETLRSQVGAAPISADYQFQAPRSFAFTVNGTDEIDIGALTYSQAHPGAVWTVENTGAAFGWPSPYFRQAWANATAIRVVGVDVIDGVPSHIVAFVRPDIPAWFELWIGDSDGLVRREEMRAEGHLMEHEYSGFSAPIMLTSPR
jgi:copper transport protein